MEVKVCFYFYICWKCWKNELVIGCNGLSSLLLPVCGALRLVSITVKLGANLLKLKPFLLAEFHLCVIVAQTDDLEGRVRAHRSKEGMQRASFLYFVVPGKSLACQLETLLINQLPVQGFQLVNRADGKHRNFGTSDHSVEVVTLHQ